MESNRSKDALNLAGSLREWLKLAMVLIVLYWVIASVVYMWRHPEKTERECLLAIWDVVRWR